MKRADKLEVAAIVAPVLRDTRRTRPIKIVDKDGNVVGERAPSEVTRAMFARAGVELEVQADRRPTHLTCASCGTPFAIGQHGGAQRSRCRKCDRWTCARLGCGRLVADSQVKRARLENRSYAFCSHECYRLNRFPQDDRPWPCAGTDCQNMATEIAIKSARKARRDYAFCSHACAARHGALIRPRAEAAVWLCAVCGRPATKASIKAAKKIGRDYAFCSISCSKKKPVDRT